MSVIRETLLNKVAASIAGAALIGGGTVVLSTAQTNAVQERHIAELERRAERSDDAIDRLNSTVQQLDKNVAVLNERLNTHEPRH